MSQHLSMILTSNTANNSGQGQDVSFSAQKAGGKDDEFSKALKKDLDKSTQQKDKDVEKDKSQAQVQAKPLSEEELEQLISDLENLLQDPEAISALQQWQPSGEVLPLEGQNESLDGVMGMLGMLPPNQLDAVMQKVPESVGLLQNRFIAQSYFAQMNNPYTVVGGGVSALAGELSAESMGEQVDRQLLDSGLGIKSQQHDRLANVAISMRQELAAERRNLDVRQQEALAQIEEGLLDEGDDGAFNHFVTNNTTPSTTQSSNTTAINLPVNHPKWGNALSEKVVWMMNSQIKEAEIKLNPGTLGSIEIKLSLQDDQANVAFNVHSSQAKEALESALPRLREMFAELGVALNDTDVSDQSAAKDDESHNQQLAQAVEGPSKDDEGDLARVTGVAQIEVKSGLDLYI